MVPLIGMNLSARAQQLAAQDPAKSTIGADFAHINQSLQRSADQALSPAPEIQTRTEASQNNNIPPAMDGALTQGPTAWRVNRRTATLGPMLAPILEEYGIPMGLLAVVSVESGGRPEALSAKGARGLWQLMPQTARRYGLVVDQTRDERLDVTRSTTAAAHYLKDLYLQFGSWPLALAAYNWGEQNLASAISRIHTADFTVLTQSGALPAETRAYVPAVLAKWKTRETPQLERSGLSGTTVFAEADPSTSHAGIKLSSLPSEGISTDATTNRNKTEQGENIE
jgi:soluble lytic murein transglycosylase-like protein